MGIFRKEVPPDFSGLIELGSKLITALEENTRATHELLSGPYNRRGPYRKPIRRGVPEEKAPHLRQAIDNARPEGYLTISEAARKIGLSESGLRYRMSRENIPWMEVWAAAPVNKVYFVKESDLPVESPRKFPEGSPKRSPKGEPKGEPDGGFSEEVREWVEKEVEKEAEKKVVKKAEEPAPPGFLTIAEVSEALGITGEGVRHRIRKGQLEAFKQPATTGGRYRYLVSQEALSAAPARYGGKSEKSAPQGETQGEPQGEASLPEDMANIIKYVSEAEVGLKKLEAFRGRHQDKPDKPDKAPDKVPD